MITKRRILLAVAACELSLLALDAWLILTDRDMIG